MVAIFGEATPYVEGPSSLCTGPAAATGICTDTFSRVVAETQYHNAFGAGWGNSELYFPFPSCAPIPWLTGSLSGGTSAFSVDGSVGIMRGNAGQVRASISYPSNAVPIEVDFDMTLTDYVLLFFGFPAWATQCGVIYSVGFPSPFNGSLTVEIDMTAAGDHLVSPATFGFPAGDTSDSWVLGNSPIGAVGSTDTFGFHVTFLISASGCSVTVDGNTFTCPGWPYATVGGFTMQGLLGGSLSTPMRTTIDNFAVPCAVGTGTATVSTLDVNEPNPEGYVP